MPVINETSLPGVLLANLSPHDDDRGTFAEIFRASWFPGDRRWVQWNVSRSRAGVLRGLHFHLQQTDYWFLVEGSLLVALVDLRPNSPSYRRALCLEMHTGVPQGVIIPPRVLHGYRALRDVTTMYLIDRDYSGGDEYGVRWDDPDLGLPETWRGGPPPLLSPRDAGAPSLADVLDREASEGR